VNNSPAHWYPPVSRVEEIDGELENLEQLAFHHAKNIDDFLPHISTSLKSAHNFPGFPQHQIRQWIWVASQFRLHAPDFSEVVGLTGSALNFMGKVLADKSNLSTEDLQDLNWVLGSTVEKLTTLLGPSTLRSYLSLEELAEVESRLEHFKALPPISAEEHKSRVESHISEIRSLSNKGFLATLCTKIDTLIEAVERLEGEGAAIAGAALHYLAEEHDVVPDSIGFLGLLDDIYVIEWAYSVIEGHTTWLPFLEEMLERWPFVDDLAFGEGKQKKKLDRWSRYVVCAALLSFFGGRQNNLLILRETGPYGLLATLAVALEIQRSRSIQTKDGPPPFEMDQPILIGDETKQFKAVFDGLCEFAGPNKYWLKVRDGRTTISKDDLSAARPSPAEHRMLSKGNEISEWRKSRHPDPLAHIVGRDAAAPATHRGVLLLTMKKQMEEFLPLIRPFGVTIQSLFGMRYVTTTGKGNDLLGSATDHPLIYACSDPSVALDLVKNRPDHLSDWLVIADGARTARAIQASLAASGDFADTRLCAIAQLHNREACRDIVKAGLKPWYLQDLDVEVPPLESATPRQADNALERFFTRQHIHWSTSRSIHVVEQSFYEGLAKIFHDLRRHLRERGADRDPNLEFLGMNVSTFIRKSLEYPLDLTSELKNELKILAKRIFSYSTTLRGFSDDAALICEHFRDVRTGDVPVCNREAKLVELVEAAIQRGEKEIAILCRSSHIAAKCEAATGTNPQLSSVKWVNMDALRRMSPVDRVIIPGWIDRITMRDLGNNCYGNFLDLVLLPYEAGMFDSGISAGQRWESTLSKNNSARYAKLRTAVGSKGSNRRGLWKTKGIADTEAATPEEAESAVLEPIEEKSFDFEYLEAQVAEAIKNQTDRIASSGGMVSATLVLFEEVGAYAYLPPKGRVIALSDVVDETGFGEKPSEQELEGTKAEKMLFRSVSNLHPGLLLAFPEEGDRDLLDARADQSLENAEKTRRISSLWKSALYRHFENTGETYAAFSQKMEEAGEGREPSTIRSWVMHSQSVAPRNFKVTVPLISNFTEDEELRSHLQQTLDAIEKIYDARAEAAVEIVKEIFSGDINLEADILTFEIEGSVLTYQLQRVAAVKETREIPVELIGRVNKLSGDLADDQHPQDLQP
jgi:hypothetical protein